MLIEKKPEINSTVIAKLTSGEEIIGRLLKTSTDSITLQKPFSLVRVIIDNQQSIQLEPVLVGCDPSSSIEINKTGIAIMPVQANTNMSHFYSEQTSSLRLA